MASIVSNDGYAFFSPSELGEVRSDFTAFLKSIVSAANQEKVRFLTILHNHHGFCFPILLTAKAMFLAKQINLWWQFVDKRTKINHYFASL